MVIGLAYFLQQFEPHQKWDWNNLFVNGFRVIFSYPCTYNPQNNANRILFVFVMFGAIIFTVLLNSSIVSFVLTSIESRQIQCVPDILDGGFKLVGGQFELNKMIEQNQVK